MRNIRAIAFNTIAQTLRMKIAVVIVILLLILLPLMSVVMSGDGTLLGKLQSFTSYGLSLVSVLLCLFTIIIACFTLSNDIRRRHLDMVITKPIRRYQVVLGKFVGVVLLDAFLLAVFAAIIYGLTLLMPKLQEADARQMATAKAEFFTARQVVQPAQSEAALRAAAEERFRELKAQDRIPADMEENEVLNELLHQERTANKSVEMTAVKEWEFTGLQVPTDPNAIIFIQYKFNASPEPSDSQVFGQWRVGDLGQFQLGAQAAQSPIYGVERTESVRDQHEFAVFADCISEDGSLTVAFFNNPNMNNCTVIFEELSLLYRVGSFENNFFRAVLLIAMRLVSLAALGVSLSTWLSFPVAVLASQAYYLIGLVYGFLVQAISGFDSIFGALYTLIRMLLYLLPRFDGPFNPTDYIVSGHMIGWAFIGKAFLFAIVIQTVLLILTGIWIFHRREIAKVTV